MALIAITHAGGYKLAYDRLGNSYGELEPDPDGRRFYGSQELQDALNQWAGHLPRVMRPPNYILSAGLYVDKPGTHSQGIAIDVDGFWISDADHYMALSAPNDWGFYLKIEATLRQVFGTVLNYDYNLYHRDHWHCDLSRAPGWRRVRSLTIFAQRALNEIFSQDIEVDGIYGPETDGALRTTGYNFPGDWDRFLRDIIGS